jgi:uncharacterized LabA/DUF88 family protein
MTFTRRMMAFVDGENLTMRFQGMLDKMMEPSSGTKHEPDTYVWHPSALVVNSVDIVRVSYYTYVVGDDNRLKEVNRIIRNLTWGTGHYGDTNPPQGNLFPRIFKKEQKTAKRKGVDISITVDALNHVYQGSVDIVYLITGDGDYKPLIEQIVRAGKQVYLAALSDGFNETLKEAVDRFIDLDPIFFKLAVPPTRTRKRAIRSGGWVKDW